MKYLFLSLTLLFSFFSIKEDKLEARAMQPSLMEANIPSSPEFNPNTAIVDTLVAHGYSRRHALYWARIARMESGQYTSIMYREHNNMWGMSYFRHGKRPTNGKYRIYHKGKPTRFAGYYSKEEAVQEIVFYLDAANYPKDLGTLDELLKLMKKKKYFEEPLWYYKKAVLNS